MYKNLKLFIVCTLLLTVFISCKKDEKVNNIEEVKKPKVYVTIYPLYDFTQKLAGDKIDLSLIIPNGQEPHDWEPSQNDIKNLENSDLFIYNGAELESWTEKVIDALDNKNLAVVEASKGIKLLEIEEDHDHDHDDEDKLKEEHNDNDKHDEHEEGHHHHGVDPHVWLNPKNAIVQAENIERGLSKIDPNNQEFYKGNLEKLKKEFLDLDKLYRDELSVLSNKTIVVSHEAYGYLCAEYGLEQLGIEGVMAETEPDAKTIAEIIEIVKDKKITTIFTEELIEPKIAQTIAEETGAKTEYLNPLESLSEEEIKEKLDYIAVMKNNLKKLVEALK